MLLSSEFPPFRRTRSCSGFAVFLKTVLSPLTSAREATRIATLNAMPRAVMIVVVFRTVRFRKLYEMGMAISHPL